MNEMRIGTQEDDELGLLKHTITHGWPSTIREVPSEMQPYWIFREELTIEDDIVLKGTQIVIPHKKWEATLELIHEGHLGLGKCKLWAKDTVHWSGLNDQLEKVILNCELHLKYTCQMQAQTNHISWTRNTSASLVQACHCHFLFWRSFIFINYGLYRWIPNMCKLTSMTGIHVANQYKLVFSKYGWPDTLISDNGPCYTLHGFTGVKQAFSVNHITSSLHYQQSNGLAQKYVQIVKCFFNEAKEEGKDFYKCLMIYCNTCLTGSLQSPMQIITRKKC